MPPGLHSVLDADEASQARERERLLYVACTRARELLLIPELLHAKQRSWSRVLDLCLSGLPIVNLAGVDLAPAVLPEELTNTQTVEVFRSERASIDTAIANSAVTWIQPSDGDMDRSSVTEATGFELESTSDEQVPVGAGRIRGLIMHKLIEEALTGELEETVARFTDRAEELLRELASELPGNASLPSPEEMAKTVWRTLRLPDVAAIRDRLVPEWPIYRLDDAQTPPIGIVGRIDAIAYRGSEAEIVLDWKSDVSPTEADMLLHQKQMEHYLRGSNARAGAVVYMTAGTVRWVFNEASVDTN